MPTFSLADHSITKVLKYKESTQQIIEERIQSIKCF